MSICLGSSCSECCLTCPLHSPPVLPNHQLLFLHRYWLWVTWPYTIPEMCLRTHSDVIKTVCYTWSKYRSCYATSRQFQGKVSLYTRVNGLHEYPDRTFCDKADSVIVCHQYCCMSNTARVFVLFFVSLLVWVIMGFYLIQRREKMDTWHSRLKPNIQEAVFLMTTWSQRCMKKITGLWYASPKPWKGWWQKLIRLLVLQQTRGILQSAATHWCICVFIVMLLKPFRTVSFKNESRSICFIPAWGITSDLSMYWA